MVKDLPLDSLASTASSFASVHGILVERRQTDLVKEKERQQSYYECAPISLLPNAFPRTAFEQAVQVAPLFNILVDRLSENSSFLESTLAQVAEADPFTNELLQLYKKIYTDSEDNVANPWAKQADRLGLLRSDYMLQNNSIKQVELNTIASSFGALSTRVAALHRYLTTTTSTNKAVTDFLTQNKRDVLSEEEATLDLTTDGVPENFALEKLAFALHLAAQNYHSKYNNNNENNNNKKKPIILFVVQPGETNTVDQRLLEFQITQAHGWRVIRQSLTELATKAVVNPDNGALYLKHHDDGNGNHDDDDDDMTEEVAVIYYRAGYAPTDYFGDKEWQARSNMECSRAVKSPCLGYHLAGTKKVQQALARPGVLESILNNKNSNKETTPPEQVQQLQDVFAGLYSLGQDMVPDDYRALESILLHENESQFVLKPQREGGGYNFYGSQMADRLKAQVTLSSTSTSGDDNDNAAKITAINHQVLGEYILMERLFPPEQRAILLRGGQVEGSGPSVSELGCFGTILCQADGTVLHNEYAGFLMRTKFSHVDEGGVAAGYATLSSPYLV
eukprot:CAMPEP_0198148864 /NCGR_PEP_ID=MMETSP1443-20131203/43784_1 /TAXON_ID=186043 /ORGANISM="Entomoneis sp., Strain CCMP2396" /LENGTH=563 /DNA_ID=CAMNT_0043813713 /DNA_START=482 /DNA_END=2173 /DNA_ORIENTATION=-